MNINSIQGANAYTATQPIKENSLVQNQNREAAQTDLNLENNRVIQEAFEVNITHEARAAADAESSTEAPQSRPAAPPQSTEPAQNLAQGNRQPTSPIVDIVA